MNSFEPFDCFHLDDDLVLHQEIDSVPTIERVAAIYEWKRFLPFDLEPPLEQLEQQACFVGRFQQPRAQFLMNGERGTDDLLR